MARLPDVQERASPVPTPAGGVASYEPSAGRGLAALAQTERAMSSDYAEVVSLVAATNARQDEQVALAAANRLHEARIDLEFNTKTGFRNVKEGGAVGQPFIDQYGQQFGKSVSLLRDGLHNENQRKIFEKHAEVHGLQLKASLLQHQSHETEKFNDSTDNSAIDLSLRSMAQRPTDETQFQLGMANINARLDAMGQRKGVPRETLAVMKAKMLESAYTARITSIMDGIPGVVQSDPYSAERMFKQVQGQLGPDAQVRLAYQVQKAVQSVQQRDYAKAILYGQPAADPKTLYPVIEGPPLEAIVRRMESGGNVNAVSPKGAIGDMQVMPATAANPGFGVRPAQAGPDGKIPQEEMTRVGRDYLGAMTARYQSPALIMAAYNAGPGEVDKWLAKNGDPRTGQVSLQDWVQKIPFDETRKYVTKGLQLAGGLSSAPTKNELKTELPAKMEQARALAERLYPGDVAFADGMVARLGSYANQELAAVQAQQSAAFDYFMRKVVGDPQKDDGAKDIDQLLASSQDKAVWNQLTPEAQYGLQQRLKKGDNKLDQGGFDLYYEILGKAGKDDKSEFLGVNLNNYFGKMPDHLLVQLAGMQKSINAKDAESVALGTYQKRAFDSAKQMLDPVLASIKDKTKKETAEARFRGMLHEAVKAEHEQTGKWPNDERAKQLAAGLLAKGKIDRPYWFDPETVAFQAENLKDFYVPLPSHGSNEYRALVEAYVRKENRVPTDAELQADVTRRVLNGKKLPWMK